MVVGLDISHRYRTPNPILVIGFFFANASPDPGSLRAGKWPPQAFRE